MSDIIHTGDVGTLFMGERGMDEARASGQKEQFSGFVLTSGDSKKYRLLGPPIRQTGLSDFFFASDGDQRVRVKTLPNEMAFNNPKAKEHVTDFLREAKVMARLGSTALEHHIMPILSVGISRFPGSEDEKPYMILPDFNTRRAMTLARILKINGPISLEEGSRLLDEVGHGLDWAADQKIPTIHKDVKPSNILLDKIYGYVIYDWGISAMDESGGIMGTPPYISPEQVSHGGTISRKSDVYALGATLYEMLTGKPLFEIDEGEGGTVKAVVDVLYKPVNEEPLKEIAKGNPLLEKQLIGFFKRVLNKDPKERPETCTQMAAEFKGIVNRARLYKKVTEPSEKYFQRLAELDQKKKENSQK